MKKIKNGYPCFLKNKCLLYRFYNKVCDIQKTLLAKYKTMATAKEVNEYAKELKKQIKDARDLEYNDYFDWLGNLKIRYGTNRHAKYYKALFNYLDEVINTIGLTVEDINNLKLCNINIYNNFIKAFEDVFNNWNGSYILHYCREVEQTHEYYILNKHDQSILLFRLIGLNPWSEANEKNWINAHDFLNKNDIKTELVKSEAIGVTE